jgi:hypothetical protein
MRLRVLVACVLVAALLGTCLAVVSGCGTTRYTTTVIVVEDAGATVESTHLHSTTLLCLSLECGLVAECADGETLGAGGCALDLPSGSVIESGPSGDSWTCLAERTLPLADSGPILSAWAWCEDVQR